MATLEQVEKLRQKVDCTYDEARSALDACEGDLLEALIYLERNGKQSKDQQHTGTTYSTRDGGGRQEGEYNRTTTHTTYTSHNSKASDGINSFFSWLGRIIKRGNANSLDIINHGDVVLSIPLIVLVLLMVFCFWFMIPALIIGLFCGLRYQFSGKDFSDTRANDFMDSASRAAENAKQRVQDEFNESRSKKDNSHYYNEDEDEGGYTDDTADDDTEGNGEGE